MYPDGNDVRGNPSRIVYSYHGIIRVSKHCEGKYAKQFRDWAEDDVALEKMFRKRKEGLTEIGFGGTVSIQKAIDSICKDT